MCIICVPLPLLCMLTDSEFVCVSFEHQQFRPETATSALPGSQQRDEEQKKRKTGSEAASIKAAKSSKKTPIATVITFDLTTPVTATPAAVPVSKNRCVRRGCDKELRKPKSINEKANQDTNQADRGTWPKSLMEPVCVVQFEVKFQDQQTVFEETAHHVCSAA